LERAKSLDAAKTYKTPVPGSGRPQTAYTAERLLLVTLSVKSRRCATDTSVSHNLVASSYSIGS